MPDFERAREEYPDVKFLMINATDGESETKETARAYIDEMGYGFDVYYDVDEDAIRTYRINAFPSTYFIDKYGNMIARCRGKISYETLVEGIAQISE